jgi:hypothetical protein
MANLSNSDAMILSYETSEYDVTQTTKQRAAKFKLAYEADPKATELSAKHMHVARQYMLYLGATRKDVDAKVKAFFDVPDKEKIAKVFRVEGKGDKNAGRVKTYKQIYGAAAQYMRQLKIDAGIIKLDPVKARVTSASDAQIETTPTAITPADMIAWFAEQKAKVAAYSERNKEAFKAFHLESVQKIAGAFVTGIDKATPKLTK